MRRHGVDVRRRHVGGHGLDPGPAATQAFPEILQGIPSLSIPDVNHRPRFQVQDHGQVAMAFANGNLVDGDLSQVFQFRPVEPPLQIGFLNILDHVPTDAQVLGDILDGHIEGKFQGVPLKGFGIGDARVGEVDLHLSHYAAAATLHPRHGQHQVHRLAADRDGAKSAVTLPASDNLVRPTHRTSIRFARLLDRENHPTPRILRLHVPIASNPERMVK